MTPPVLHTEDPSLRVVQTFQRIQRERMAEVPILHPALAVEAVGFQRWQGQWLGMLVTPWCMSVLLLPGQAAGWQSVAGNKRRFVRLPAGDFAFLGSREEGLGEFQTCSLFSPMQRFAGQSEAVATARASLVALLQPLAAPAPQREAGKAPGAGRPDTADAARTPASPSRRRFLFGPAG